MSKDMNFVRSQLLALINSVDGVSGGWTGFECKSNDPVIGCPSGTVRLREESQAMRKVLKCVRSQMFALGFKP